ncbi:hypothetical protein [Mycoplasma procyoni]|uniref:hypothetical protein n=1 Tax=Mycoplasma procyoni TaxID=568784 RepID=UPI00197BD32F|nr:hypothetical protein [Mycoplasma procyoni]MBN3534683.1 hypothetical protein [Mycoplasma procyoni]
MKNLINKVKIKHFLKQKNNWEKYKYIFVNKKMYFLSLKLNSIFKLDLSLSFIKNFENNLIKTLNKDSFLELTTKALENQGLCHNKEQFASMLSEFLYLEIERLKNENKENSLYLDYQSKKIFNKFTLELKHCRPDFNLFILKILKVVS